MLKKNKKFVLKIFVVICFLLISVSARAAGVPTVFSYQGRLTNATGDLVGGAGTTYYFKFSIWSNSVVGTGVKLWPVSDPSSVSLTVRQGVFNANIDVQNYNFNTSNDIYLQVEVSANNISFETLSPRQQISSSVFSQISGAVSGVGQSSFGTTMPADNAVVTIAATSTSAIPMLIRSFAGQMADLFKIEDSSLNHLFSINSTGGLFASSTFAVGPSAGNTSFFVNNSGSVGVGTANPGRKFSVLDVNSVPQFRLSQSDTVYSEFRVDSAGDIHLSSPPGGTIGGNVRLDDQNLWVCAGENCGVTDPGSKGNIIVETAVIFNNQFKMALKDYPGATSTTVMLDSLGNEILEFDEGQ